MKDIDKFKLGQIIVIVCLLVLIADIIFGGAGNV